MNIWSFTGRVLASDRRATSSGKIVHTMTVHREAHGERGRAATVRCQYWHETCPANGTPVVVSGRFGSWTGKDGSAMMDLVADEVTSLDLGQGNPAAKREESRGVPDSAIPPGTGDANKGEIPF